MSEEHHAKHAAAEHPSTTSAAPAAAATAKKSSNKTLWIVLGLVAFFVIIVPALFLTIGGIFLKNRLDSNKLTEKTLETAFESATGGAVDVDSKSGSFNVKSKDGDSSVGFGSNQEMPKDFPKDAIPYLKEKNVTFVMTSATEGKKSWSVTTTVNDSYEEAKSYFAGKIVEPDYTSVTNYGFGDSTTYYGNGTKYDLSVSITEGASGEPTTVSYIVTEN